MLLKAVIICFTVLCFTFLSRHVAGQPWKAPLRIAWSADGVTFGPSVIFQDSSGVPSVIQWHGDTLIAAFQWFRVPNPSPTWDRVAVKFSYDKGITWTQPLPIVVTGLPAAYQRPFDPTLVRIADDSLRIFFSSSNGNPMPGADSVINTYSAKSGDGVHYVFESGPRVDVDSNRVIDPAIILFNGAWHYLAPAGAPQQGAYHYLSPDGFNFSPVPKIVSDNVHNWTGNYMVESSSELRFYGSAPNNIWYNATANGGVWTGYVSTNVQGGDPSVLKVGANSYLMVYTGPMYATAVARESQLPLSYYPNPACGELLIRCGCRGARYVVSDVLGRYQGGGVLSNEVSAIDISRLNAGAYVLRVIGYERTVTFVKR